MFNLVLWSFVLALTPWTLGLAWKRFSVVGEWNRGILSRAVVEVRQWRSPHSRGIDASEDPARWPAEGARVRDGSQQRSVRGLIGVRHARDVSTSSSPPTGPVTLAWAPESPGHVMPTIAPGDRRKSSTIYI
jgi:hypothetical protein